MEDTTEDSMREEAASGGSIIGYSYTSWFSRTYSSDVSTTRHNHLLAADLLPASNYTQLSHHSLSKGNFKLKNNFRIL